MPESRRAFLKSSGLVLGFAVAGALLPLTPSQARARQLPMRVLRAAEVETLEAVAEGLVPGATEAGISHFLDQQLAASAEDNLLMLKYLGVAAADQLPFYRSALGSIEALAQQRFKASCQALDTAQLQQLLALLAADDTPGWQAAPASFVFFVLRSDAVDVVYGTAAGSKAIGLPYMPHIQPETPW